MHALPYIAKYTQATERSSIELFSPHLPQDFILPHPLPPQGTAVAQWLMCCATNILPIQYIDIYLYTYIPIYARPAL